MVWTPRITRTSVSTWPSDAHGCRGERPGIVAYRRHESAIVHSDARPAPAATRPEVASLIEKAKAAARDVNYEGHRVEAYRAIARAQAAAGDAAGARASLVAA